MMTKEERILMDSSGKKFLVRDCSKDFHCQFGLIKKEDLKKSDGDQILTNKNYALSIFSPVFNDLYSKIKRGAQIIPSKDVGYIISETGIGKKSTIVDAGAGSGGLSLMLANIVKKIYTFDIRDDHIDIVKKNIETLGLKNIVVKKGNIYSDKLPIRPDVITLDVPEPWEAIDNINKYLKTGGFVVSYSPSIPQVSDLINFIEEKYNKKIIHIKTTEIIEREWEFSGRKIRPKTQQRISHSGFLTFLRKIS